MDVGNILIAFVIVAAIILGVVVFRSISRTLSTVTDTLNTLVTRSAQILDGVTGRVADLVNPDAWRDKSAAFCCDVYTPEQIDQMVGGSAPLPPNFIFCLVLRDVMFVF